MNKFILLFCIISFNKPMTGQISVDSLEKKLLALEEKIFVSDSTSYANYYNVSYEAYFLFDKLNYRATGFYNNIKNDIFLIELLNVNNPNSLELRKRILDELQKSIVSKVYDVLGKDSTKKRGLFKTIRTIFSSPIAQDILKYIPFNNTINSIIGNISSLVTPETKSRNVALTSIVEATGDIKAIFENTPLNELSKDILPYIQFYDSLYILNNRFAGSMEIIKSKAYELNDFVATKTPVMQNLSGWNPEASMMERIVSFDNLYVPLGKVRNNQKFNTSQIVKMQQFYNVANPVIDTYNKYLQLQKEYNTKFASIKQDYLRLLERFKNKNKIFETMLSPIVLNLQQLDKPENISVIAPPPPAPMVLANIPKYGEAEEKRLKEIMQENASIEAKYRESNEIINSYRIKKTIFK